MLNQVPTPDSSTLRIAGPEAVTHFRRLSIARSQLSRAESLAVRAMETLSATGHGDDPDVLHVLDVLAEIAHENGERREAVRLGLCAARLRQRLGVLPAPGVTADADVDPDVRAEFLYQRARQLFDRALSRCALTS